MDNLGLDRTETDRDRLILEPIVSIRLSPTLFPGPIGPVHLDLWDQSVQSKSKFPSVQLIGPTDWTEVFVA